ncbi:MAG: UDP-N-acetylmuramate dehydrogenase [Thermotogota bacterium]|nr:UDP-N-acetylmuramate dehydrogenase [Thermotogota bacterium]
MSKTKSSLYDFLYRNHYRFTTNESLKSHTTIGIGGSTSAFILPSTENSLFYIVSYLRNNHIEYRIIGGGSNVIPKDDVNEVIISTRNINQIEYSTSGIVVDAGVSINKLVPELIVHELSGFEFLSGLPGTIGGALYMNAGAFGREIGDFFESARVIDKEGTIITVEKNETNFGYRNSIFQKKGFIILTATFCLNKESKIKIEKRSDAILKQRINKQPVNWKSAGSIFKKPTEDFSVGYAIEKLGLKGIRFGGAKVSKKHAGFIINRGNATQMDVKQLVNFLKNKVKNHFGVLLETEVELW